MEGIGGDLFATKGLEYVLVMVYLLLLVACWRLVGPRSSESRSREPTSRLLDALSFPQPEGFHYHQGHAWAFHEGDGLMRVGVDDFVQQLLGPVTGLILPPVGAHLGEGEAAFRVRIEGASIPVLSPVDGVVVAWNEEVLRSPGLVNSAPHEAGWLLEVRVRNPAVATRNLLSGRLARAWMDEVAARLQEWPLVGPHAPPFEDGSSEIGLARVLSPDAPDALAREFLLSEGEVDWWPHRAGATHRTEQEERAQLV